MRLQEGDKSRVALLVMIGFMSAFPTDMNRGEAQVCLSRPVVDVHSSPLGWESLPRRWSVSRDLRASLV